MFWWVEAMEQPIALVESVCLCLPRLLDWNLYAGLVGLAAGLNTFSHDTNWNPSSA